MWPSIHKPGAAPLTITAKKKHPNDQVLVAMDYLHYIISVQKGQLINDVRCAIGWTSWSEVILGSVHSFLGPDINTNVFCLVFRERNVWLKLCHLGTF